MKPMSKRPREWKPGWRTVYLTFVFSSIICLKTELGIRTLRLIRLGLGPRDTASEAGPFLLQLKSISAFDPLLRSRRVEVRTRNRELFVQCWASNGAAMFRRCIW